MTDTMNTEMQPAQTHPARKKNSTVKNTLRCVIVLSVIAIVCVSLLAVANRFLRVEATLDGATAALINRIAPTGVDDGTALSGGYIKMVNLRAENYAIKDLDAYNKQHGTANQKVRALYTSKNAEGKITYVVEAEGKGYVDAVVMLVAYDAENKVSGVITKSQNESYWNHIKNEEKLYAAFVGLSGRIESSQIAASTGVTVMGTLGGMTSAVSIANDFVSRLGGEPQKPAPFVVTDADLVQKLKKVSDATVYTCYTVQTATVDYVFTGNNGDLIVQSRGDGGTYGQVALLVRVADGKAVKLAYAANPSFDPTDEHDSTLLKNEEKLNELFGGKTIAEINAMAGDSLPGFTGVTQSSDGLKMAVKNALEYAPTFDRTQFGEVAQ